MIQPGSTVILETKEATYSPCKVVRMSDTSVTIQFYRPNKNNKKSGGFETESISMKDVVSISERF